MDLNNLISMRVNMKLNVNYFLILFTIILIFLSLISVIKLELVVNGLVMGSIISLGAIGLTLIYGNLKFAHIAHGDFMTISAYIVLFMLIVPLNRIGMTAVGLGPFTFGYPLLIALPFAIIFSVAIAIALDLTIYRRLRNRGVNTIFLAMASLGVAIAGRGLVQLIWGGDIQQFPRMSKLFFQLPMNVRIPPDALFIAAVSLTLTLFLHFFLTRSRMGKAMRATADNIELARVAGINTELVLRWTWVLGIGFAAVAGVLLAVFQAQLLPMMGWKFLIPLFAAVILGGVGNPYGAFVGAMIVGVSGEVSTEWISPSYRPAIAFAILIGMLLIRPKGIFGKED